MFRLPSMDDFILQFDQGLRTLFVKPHSVRSHPDAALEEAILSEAERKQVIALMRVNHVGEVCAQALYQGQALFARQHLVKDTLQHAAKEEIEHLAWTQQRIQELGGRTSLLNPLWYAGSLGLGMFASLCGDAWSLGFLESTEQQVSAHLHSHLTMLPTQDSKSRAIVLEMEQDESEHASLAHSLGAKTLPQTVQNMMQWSAKVMTKTAYWV